MTASSSPGGTHTAAGVLAEWEVLALIEPYSFLSDGHAFVVAKLAESHRAIAAALDAATQERDRYEEALREIAGPSPRSHRPEVEQLRDAVKWRQGIARDALAALRVVDGKEKT